MTDSFSDLWASSVPSKSLSQQPQKQPTSSAPPRRPQYDAFSILSATQPQSTPVPTSQPADRQARQPKPTSHGGDAFSDLFSSSLDGVAPGRHPDRGNLTIAERAVLAQKAKVAQNDAASAQARSASSSASLWAGLDALARPQTSSPQPGAPSRANASAQDGFDLMFDSASAAGDLSQPTSSHHDASIDNDDWGLSEFEAHKSGSRTTHAPAKPAPSSQLWALDEFASSGPQAVRSRPQAPARSLTGTPGDFDFGDRDDGLLGGDNSDVEDTFGIRGSDAEHPEDDILGDLGKPMSHSHTPSPNPSTSARPPVRPPRQNASPPPHITGQLVEMGFSPVEARAALINTMSENGFDVQTAAELLLSQAGQEGSTRLSPPPPERERRNRDMDPGVRRPPPSRTDSHVPSPRVSQTQPQSQSQIDVTAEKLLSQASEIGRGMFSKANALWKEGKERAVKMYEERAAANGPPPSDGRPRWMRDRELASGERQRPDGGFKDDEDEEHGAGQRERQRPPACRPAQPQSKPPPPPPECEPEVDLFSVDSPTTAYQSPFRRGKPKGQAQQSSSRATPVLPSGPSTSPQPRRTLTTTIASSALAAWTAHKSAGTDAYKRGDFPVAFAAYTRALSALPADHVMRVPVLTNVALVRSKVGELREAIEACEEAIGIVRRFVGGDASTAFGARFDEKARVDVGSGKVGVSVQGADDAPTVDLVEGLCKAYRRRAEALEGLEKWGMARDTWEAVLGAEWASAGIKGDAVKGVSRCRRMVEGGGEGAAQPAVPYPRARPKPKPVPTSAPGSTASPPSAALDALRTSHATQQTEDVARLACKDAVDARLAAWKSGREGNIRALLASLDESVLWPGIGWRKVGMAEVVSKGQVKGAYVRAIARVHPDKVNAETTVEQRMLANGVFGALNEAWNAFQQQQG